MVQGFCIPSGKNFADLIRQRYPATLNLGMGGNGPLIELATLKEYLTVSRPRLVLWVYYEGNDFQDLAKERRHHFLMQYLMKEFRQDLHNRQTDLDQSLAK